MFDPCAAIGISGATKEIQSTAVSPTRIRNEIPAGKSSGNTDRSAIGGAGWAEVYCATIRGLIVRLLSSYFRLISRTTRAITPI